MSKKRLLRRATLVLSLLAFPLIACEPTKMQIQLDGFTSSGIEGIVLHRADSGGTYQPVCEIHFSEFRTIVRRGQAIERIKYVQTCLDGEMGVPVVTLETNVRRPSAGSDAIQLDLWYLRFEAPGLYKASAFNAAGESPLSAASLPL